MRVEHEIALGEINKYTRLTMLEQAADQMGISIGDLENKIFEMEQEGINVVKIVVELPK